jgi:hypothetical protein
MFFYVDVFAYYEFCLKAFFDKSLNIYIPKFNFLIFQNKNFKNIF